MILASTHVGAQDPSRAVDRATQSRSLPGDRIYIHILREPLLSDTVTVNERGEAAFPKLGIVNVGSVSIGALNDTLRRRYAEYLRTPELEIVVLRRIIVNGEVSKPNVYLVDVSSTVADVIARAGGFTENANRNKIRLIRNGEARKIEGWDKGGAVASELMSGDEIVVGRRHWLSINALPAVSTLAVVGSLILALQAQR